MTLELDDFLAHYGVKGMKWGVRKDVSSNRESTYRSRYQEAKNRELSTFTVTAKNGKTVSVSETPRPLIANYIASLSDKRLDASKKFSDFKLSVDGKKIGDASFHKVSDDELNLVWLGVS